MAAIRRTTRGTDEVYGYKTKLDGTKQRFSRTFKTRAEAKRFHAELELGSAERSSQITLSALIDEYIVEATSQKRSKRTEEIRLRRLQRDKLATRTLSSITKKTIENYIERRLQERAKNRDSNISPSTVNRELTILSDVFQYAIKNELTDVNPCRGVEKPREPEHRERVASDEDIEKLLLACGWDGHTVPKNKMQLAVAAFLFSCQTAMCFMYLLRLQKHCQEETWPCLQELGKFLNLLWSSSMNHGFLADLTITTEIRYSEKCGIGPVLVLSTILKTD